MPTLHQTAGFLAGRIALPLALLNLLTPAAFEEVKQPAPVVFQTQTQTLHIPACTQAFKVASGSFSKDLEQPETREKLLDSIIIVQDRATIGSGTIISPQGYILTAAHLLPPNRPVAVYLNSGEVQTGQAVYRNPAQDVAVLKIEGPTPDCLSLRSRWLPSGSRVYSVGFSTEQGGRFMLGRGQLLGYRRPLNQQSATYIETGMDLLPGSSGGPLLDSSGQVVGIISRKMQPARQPAHSYAAVTTSIPGTKQVGMMNSSF
jgi:S1-C subfamily serine protease